MIISQSSLSMQNLLYRRIATALSLVAAVIYLIIALGYVPDDFESPPDALMFIAGIAYLVGGLIILRAGRRLLQVGAIINLLVIVAFVISLVAGNSTADALSLTGKAAQIGLEVALVWLIRQESSESGPHSSKTEAA